MIGYLFWDPFSIDLLYIDKLQLHGFFNVYYETWTTFYLQKESHQELSHAVSKSTGSELLLLEVFKLAKWIHKIVTTIKMQPQENQKKGHCFRP